MAGKLKVHVDQDKCQGHARCKALAPELFDLDEFGNAHEAGDGSVPAGTRGQGLARKIQLSGDRDRRHRRVNRFAPLPAISSERTEEITLMSDPARAIPDSAPAALTDHPPVTDWIHDFDHTDPQWTEDPFPIWEELRAASPVIHTDRFLGCYMPTTYQAVKEIAYDTEHFSSRRVIVRDVRPEISNAAPPITSDPPGHKPAKQLLLPPFTPDAMKKLEPRVRAICNELIDEFIADGQCDAAARYTKHIPVRAIAHMLGIPERDGELFIKWIHGILELGIKDDDALMGAVREMTGYFPGHVEARKTQPDRRPDHDLDECQGQGRPAAGRRARAGLAAAVADRRHRHHLERDRLLALASGEDARRS